MNKPPTTRAEIAAAVEQLRIEAAIFWSRARIEKYSDRIEWYELWVDMCAVEEEMRDGNG